MFSKVNHGRLMLLSVALACLGLGALVDGLTWSAPDVTPDAIRFGWDEKTAVAELPGIVASMPKFAITDADGNAVSGDGKNAELWKFAKVANGGQHLPTWRQQSSDCVSMGASNAVAYRQSVQIAQDGQNQQLRIPAPHYTYGISRVQIGKRSLGRQGGSLGVWGAQACQSYGILPVEKANELGFPYSGQLANRWGFDGPPKVAIDYASKYRMRTVAQVRSWEDLRDALVHGFPVTIASNVGFNGGSYDRDGKRWLRPAGSWPHQMCVIGVEDRPNRTKGAYIINSWGTDAHPKPLNDEPPGGFWADWQTMQRIVSQGDSWAYSDFDGFPADSSVDWNIFRDEAIQAGNDAAIVAAETPTKPEVIKETRKMYALPIAMMLLGAAGVGLSFVLSQKFPKMRNAAAMLLAVGLIGSIVDAEAGPRHRARKFGMYQANYYAHTDRAATNQPISRRQQRLLSATDFQPFSDKPAALTVADFNPFASTDPTATRTYADCWATESEFLVCVGTKEKPATSLPVAYEEKLGNNPPGVYRVWNSEDGKSIEPYSSHPTVASAPSYRKVCGPGGCRLLRN